MADVVEQVLIERILKCQDQNGCFHVLQENDPYYPQYNYYVPNYCSTLWTLVLLADLNVDPHHPRLRKPLQVLTDQLWDSKAGIYTIGKSHFPIPCLNGNMVYLHSYFQSDEQQHVESVLDFFAKYQRFDDGDFDTPSIYPYCSNKSCYGNHSCYWGVVKLLKGISFIPASRRTESAMHLLQQCTQFILLHEVCYRSHNRLEFIHTNIKKRTFPNMYESDYLEILWLLKRENIYTSSMQRALALLESKMEADGTWKIERSIKNLTTPIGRSTYGNELVTKRANEVMTWYRGLQQGIEGED